MHRQEDYDTVHSVELKLGDDPALPTIDEPDGSVHGSDVDGKGAESNSEERRLYFLPHDAGSACR